MDGDSMPKQHFAIAGPRKYSEAATKIEMGRGRGQVEDLGAIDEAPCENLGRHEAQEASNTAASLCLEVLFPSGSHIP